MAADTLSPPILDYIANGAYPDSESVAAATLTSSDLAAVLQSLQIAQDEARSEIRTLSASTAGDIDTWIANAKALQADILRSREVARQIVQEAEQAEKLKAEVEDKGNKVSLLEKEVDFNETLTGTLEHVRHANGLLQRAQDEAVKANVGEALERLEDAEASIAGLESVQASRTCEVLNGRAEELRRGLRETVTECWKAVIAINHEQRTLTVERDGLKTAVPEAAVPQISLDQLVQAAKGLDIFDPLVLKLGKDLDRAVFRSRLTRDEDKMLASVNISGNVLGCTAKSHDLSSKTLFHDLQRMFEFLVNRLPPAITIPLSATLMPALTGRLENHWLDQALPSTLAEVREFSPLLEDVSELADQIDKLGWHGSNALREWVSNAPRSWLTKRREAVLGDVRGLVFTGLQETKTVERVETRLVSNSDQMLGGDGQQESQGGDDDWDTAWDEPDDGSVKGGEKKSVKAEDDEDDASAWDIDDEEVDNQDKTPNGDGGDDDAWGWGDGDEEPASAKPSSPTISKKQAAVSSPPGPNGTASQPAPQEQELTLRETFTTTQVPDGILTILQTLVSDAETLATDPLLSESPIAPAASALYTLPTLALAIYRATAPTAYSRLPVGNMLIYNDASHLSAQLREWQASQPPATRLRLDKDADALDAFAKRAYGSEMESQRTILRDLLDGAQGFANCTTPPFKGECESAVEQTVDRLRDVHGQWQPILSQGALLQSLGSLLSTVTGKIISDVQDLADISEPESAQLKTLLGRVGRVTDIFTQQAQAGQEGAGGGGQQDLTFIYSPNWLKFQYLAEIMDSSLADIKWMWREGELSLEFEADEVVELIRALFAESELRRRAIAEIRGGGR